MCLARWYQARRSVVHPQDDAANSIITICVAYMSLTKNTILMRSRLCMYITGDRRTVAARRGFVALIAHRYYLRPVQPRFPPSVREKLLHCVERAWNWDGGSPIRRSGTKTRRYILSARIQVAKFQSANSRDFSHSGSF